MSLQSEIQLAADAFALNLSNEFYDQLNKALKLGSKGGRVQESKIQFYPKVTQTKDGVTIQVLASDEYWYYIDKGRKPGKMPPPDKLGKKWQAANNIDARQVIAEINAKSKKKGLSVNKKGLDYNKAAKQLSFLIARSIGLRGYKARPYVENTLKSGWVEQFQKQISEIMSREIVLEITVK